MLERIKQKKEEKKDLFRNLQNQDTVSTIIEERKKSSNERELERYMKEDYEKKIKEQLEFMRKKRRDDIAFNHNPLNVKNITNHVAWNVLKEKKLFSDNKNMFMNQKNIFKNNKPTYKSKRLFKLK